MTLMLCLQLQRMSLTVSELIFRKAHSFPETGLQSS
jgi:hypothetical protein